MAQLLLFADPQPLVERLGVQFFRQAPQTAGVYLMRDATEGVLYVGKAKNLRQRLAHYRVANPDRMKRRHLRLLRQVARIELEEWTDERAALEREAELLRRLRPRYNRAGTWSGPLSALNWRLEENALQLAVLAEAPTGWKQSGPLGGAFRLRASLARLCWCAIHSERGLVDLPAGWFEGHHGPITTIAGAHTGLPRELPAWFDELFRGQAEALTEWILQRTANQRHPIDIVTREEDLETIRTFAVKFASASKTSSACAPAGS